MIEMKHFTRRQFLSIPVFAAAGVAAVKLGGRWLFGTAPGTQPLPALQYLSAHQAHIVTAAALAMVGPAAERAYVTGTWSPVADFEALLARLPQHQRTQIGVGLYILEEWTLGLSGFSSWTREEQREQLARWRTSTLSLHRSIWSFLHASCCSSFSGTDAGWSVMSYPGPCVKRRAPGQTAPVIWDDRVP